MSYTKYWQRTMSLYTVRCSFVHTKINIQIFSRTDCLCKSDRSILVLHTPQTRKQASAKQGFETRLSHLISRDWNYYGNGNQALEHFSKEKKSSKELKRKYKIHTSNISYLSSFESFELYSTTIRNFLSESSSSQRVRKEELWQSFELTPFFFIVSMHKWNPHYRHSNNSGKSDCMHVYV